MRWMCSNNNIRSSYEFLPVSISVYRKFEKSIKRLTDEILEITITTGRDFSIKQKFSSLRRKIYPGNRIYSVVLGMSV